MTTEPSHPRQLTLDLAHRPAFGAEDFFISKSNETAIRLIDDWPQWPQYGQMLLGPAASGKTHLVNVWRLRSQAHIIDAKALSLELLLNLPNDYPICIENLHDGPINPEALFHLLNMIDERAGHILLSSRVGVADLNFGLKDLVSRLMALPSVSINPPDEHLLKAVMIKQFSDRQIEVEPQLVEYLFKRMERSMQAVAHMVDVLDRGSLGAGRAITRPLAREILADNPCLSHQDD